MEDKLSMFGNLFVKEVRDRTLFVLEGMISGHMKGEGALETHQRIAAMSGENMEFLREFAYSMVDTSLHYMLFMLEEHADWKLSNQSIDVADLNKISDGLAGELYTSDGWIRRFSEYEPSKGLE